MGGRGQQIFACSVCITAAVWAIQLARADAAFHEGAPEGVARAIAMLPHNTEYLALGGLQREYDGADSTAQWLRIAELSPTSSGPRLALGLAAEQRGDLAQAERWLLAAYAVDHQFEPRWTLANFYFRQGRAEEFWIWIRSALEVSYGDRRPAFELCWRMSQDAERILRAIPDQEDVAADYLAFVMDRPEAVASAARKVHRAGILQTATDVLLDGARYSDAVAVWQQAGHPAPQGPTGFGWRWNDAPGVTHRNTRIELSGGQPEALEMARQYVGGLRPGADYKVEWENAPQLPGLTWRVNDRPVTEFRAASELALVSLWYERPRGEARAEASFDLRGVSLLLQ